MIDDLNAELQLLESIYKSFELPLVLSSEEKNDFIESAFSIIHDYIMDNLMLYIKPNFQSIVHDVVSEILEQNIYEAIGYFDGEILDHIIEQAFKIFYVKCIPARSFPDSFIRIKTNIEKMEKKIEYLKNIPQPEQRTKEWYEFRHNYLTASNIWKAFISNSSRNQLIYEKCCPINTEKFKNVSTGSPMHWGQKYEPVSIQWYEFNYNTFITDFGCLPHEKISYLAASPDGINTCPNSKRFGRMLEVKNIFNREINGIPKMEYWIQMQVQMEVCKLNECDFLETQFLEYINKEAFMMDGAFQKTHDDKFKGVIMYFIKDGMPHYEYAPFQSTEEEFNKWEEMIMMKNEGLTWNSNIYWKLEKISCVLVLRNKQWFSEAEPILNELWNTILTERIEGYEHRAPKKKQIKQNTTSPIIIKEINNTSEKQTSNQNKSNLIIEIDTS